LSNVTFITAFRRRIIIISFKVRPSIGLIGHTTIFLGIHKYLSNFSENSKI